LKPDSVAPFLVVADGVTNINLSINDISASSGGDSIQVSHWDENTELTIRALLQYDHKLIINECGLPDDAEISLGLTAYSMSTKRKVWNFVVLGTESECEIELIIPGEVVGGRLEIEVSLVVNDVPETTPNPLSPPRFSPIWFKKFFAELEGSFGRADVKLKDFSSTRFPHALWCFDCQFPTDAEDWRFAEINNVIRITVNLQKQDLVRTTVGQGILQEQFAVQILNALTSTPGVLEMIFDDSLQFDNCGSLFQTAKNIVGIFGHTNPESFRDHWCFQQNEAIAQIQSRAGIR
jgi:hypothetical protein